MLVTGPSGAGRSTAINVLEDLGYEAIDNLPLSLVPRLLDGPARPVPLALGLDVRNREFSAANLIELLDRLAQQPEYAPEMLFLDCSTEQLCDGSMKPAAAIRCAPMARPFDAILAERAVLASVARGPMCWSIRPICRRMT